MKKPKEIRVCSCGNTFESNHNTRLYCDECLAKIKSHQCQRDGHGGLKPCMTKKEYHEKLKNGIITPGMKGKSVLSCLIAKYGNEQGMQLYSEMVKKQQETFRKNHLLPEQKQEFIKKSVHYGNKNGMYGRSFYDAWIDRYGKEEADRRMAEYKRKKSEKSKGKNNPMYGKPAPKGSGNGISGWYKGWYFRSLRELSYMIKVIEKEGHEWKSLDNTSDFRIKYLDANGHERSYCPDFLIDNKIVVEIKPKKLQGLDLVVRKQNAAMMYCKTRNLVHIITDVEILDFSIIEQLVNNEVVRLTDKSLKKFNQYQRKHHKGECKNESE